MSKEHTSKQLKVAIGGHSSRGIKEENQDAFTALQPPSPKVRESKGCVACIADGVSSSANARVASQTSVTTFIEDYYSTPDTWDVKTSAARVLSSLNAWLYHQGQQSLARQDALVTTFSALVLKSTSLHVFHIGDSRVYRWRRGELVQLTQDHCLPHGRDEDILIRGLGMEAQLKVDYLQKEAQVGDILLLTTDGVHKTLGNQSLAFFLEETVREAAEEGTEGTRLEAAARRMTDAALEAGSSDNNSCLLVEILELPVENIDEAHRKLTRLAVPPALEPGNKLDDFTVIRVLHNGTRSHLYLASSPRFEQPVVLKLPSQNFEEDPLYLEAFIREQWIGRRVRHPDILRIHEPLPDTRFLYHVEEYVEGGSLRQWLHDHPEPPLHQVRDLVGQIAAALRAFQRAGMLHRDLKPENVMVTPQGRIKLIDFGTVHVKGLDEIASPVRDDTPVGSVDYIAPEYLLGEKGAFRSDIFSLGVIAYELLTGELPYRSPASPGHWPRSYESWQYRPARYRRRDLPAWVDLALEKACAPRPSQRYDSLSEFLRDLEVPNRQMLERLEAAPLLERNPLRVWQLISALLFTLLVLQTLL